MPIRVKFPDGSAKEFADGATSYDAAVSISKGLAKACLAAKVNGRLWDLHRPLPAECELFLIKENITEGLVVKRHSGAHILAGAVRRLFGDQVKFGVGPSIDTGFYYDMELPRKITEDDLPKIEEEMRKIVASDYKFIREDVPKEEAIHRMTKMGQDYKLELLEEIPDSVVSIYTDGDFVDLCEGPHVPSSRRVGAFKLQRITGAYWRGDSNNKMLTRIYGLMYHTEEELKKREQEEEEARKRDHRKLGKELDLFSVHDEIGGGLIHWHPRGAVLRDQVEGYWRELHRKNGYQLVYTPHIASERIYHISGHLPLYEELMYSAIDIDGQKYRVKPMNCPGHIMIYKNRVRSYRELPLRYLELGTVYRFEKAGVLHGLLRVRGFTIDDSHIFVPPDEAEQEVGRVFALALEFLRHFGFKEFALYLSTRPEKFVGRSEDWERAQNSLRRALEQSGMPFTVDEGGGAFYGPKIDVKVKDCLGREWQCSTIQFDFNNPERFDLVFTDRNNRQSRPYMVHRALMGSVERFIGVLIEHYGGEFPLWLAPIQIVVLTVGDREHGYAQSIGEKLAGEGFRVELDLSNERISYKIREWSLQKVPYLLVVGPKEVEVGTVAVRKRSVGDLGAFKIEAFVEHVKEEAKQAA